MTFADDIVARLKAEWIGTYITEPPIDNGKPSLFKGRIKDRILVFSGTPGEAGRINDNSGKIETDTAQINCYHTVLANAEKYRLMSEQIIELYTYPGGGGWWTATKLQPGEANDIHIEKLAISATVFKVRAVIS